MRSLVLAISTLLLDPGHAQLVEWMVDDDVNYTLNPAMTEHRVAAAPGALVTMRMLDVELVYGDRTYGQVALDARDPGTGALELSCLLGDSVAVAAAVVGNGVAYFAGHFNGDALELCDGTMIQSLGSGFTENRFILAWDLSTGAFLWSRNISADHPECQDITSLALDEQGRLWYLMRDFSNAQVVRVDGNGVDQVMRTISGIRHLGTISFDPWGGLYVSGSCENGILSFGGQNFPVGSDGGYNMFVLRYRPDGTAGFARFTEDVTFQDPTVVATADGHAYFAGSIFIATTWGDHTVPAPNWGSGVFIARMDSTGAFEWNIGMQQEDGVINGDMDRAEGPCISVDADGNSYFLGAGRGTAVWDNGVTSGQEVITDRTMTILAIAPTGMAQWALTSAPTTWGIEPQGITALAGEQSIHFVAHTADPFIMGGIEVGTSGVQAAVLGKVTGINTGLLTNAPGRSHHVWPDPARDHLFVEHDGQVPVLAEMRTSSGQRVRLLRLQPGLSMIDLNGLAEGLYMLRRADGSVDRFVVE